MRKQIRPSLAMAFLVPAMMVSTLAAAASPLKRQEPKTQQELVREVRHQLVMLPYYSVFDNLSYRVEGDKVILEGQVVRPTLKSDAEAAVILTIVRALPEAYRETLILRLVEGMTGPEIAARTGLKPGSVRVNLHRGMLQLREKLAEASVTSAIQAYPPSSGKNSAEQGKNALRRGNEP